MEFVEQNVPLASAILRLHADGTYSVDPPFRSSAIPWPRRMHIKISMPRPKDGLLPPFEFVNVALYQDGTYLFETAPP